MAAYFQSLEYNPGNLKDLSNVVDHAKRDPRERYEEFGTSTFDKALATNLNDAEFDHLCKAREAKGLEIQQILDENDCDALIVPSRCPNPSDLGQNPVICVPLGFFSDDTAVETSSDDLVTKGPRIPYVPPSRHS